MIVAAPRALGKHDDRAAALNFLGGELVRLEGCLTIVAIEEHDAGCFGAVTEHWNLSELGLRDEAVTRQLGSKDKNIEPAHMVRDIDGALLARQPLGIVDARPHAGGEENTARPRSRRPRINATRPFLRAKETRNDDDRREERRHDESGYGD